MIRLNGNEHKVEDLNDAFERLKECNEVLQNDFSFNCNKYTQVVLMKCIEVCKLLDNKK